MTNTNVHIGLEPKTIAIFVAITILGLVIDMWAHRAEKPITLKVATFWTCFWIFIGVAFGIYLNYRYSPEAASLYFAGYAFEMALSVDNLFAIMAIFAWFSIKSDLTHRVLYWGILGAVVFRLIFVLIGSALFALGPYVEFVFAFVVATSAILMLRKKDDTQISDFSTHPAYKAVRFFAPVFPKLVGHNFFLSKKEADAELQKPENKDLKLKVQGLFYVTPLFLCLVIVETSDVMFAFDSVPAVIAVSKDPFIVYSCMMFAILGLRSMYFVLDVLRQRLVHLEKAVIALLFFVAIKLALGAIYHLTGYGLDIDVYTSLIVIAVTISISILASFIFPKKD